MMRLHWLASARWQVGIAAAIGLSSCAFFSPTESVAVPFLVNGSQVRIQLWGDTLSEGRFEILLSNQHGSARKVLWEDWGPAQRVSLYISRDGRLIVLGGGGIAEMFLLPRSSAPGWLTYRQRPKEDGNDWHYLGAVDRDNRDLEFLRPVAQRECVPLYGAGTSSYRKAHQDRGSCSSTITQKDEDRTRRSTDGGAK